MRFPYMIHVGDITKLNPAGRRAVVIGRSLVVGQPAALLLQRRNATVTVCHTGTRDIPALCRDADIVIAATVTELLGVPFETPGKSFAREILL